MFEICCCDWRAQFKGGEVWSIVARGCCSRVAHILADEKQNSNRKGLGHDKCLQEHPLP